MQTVGSRAQVWHNNAHHTSGGLTKKNLFMNKRGRIVSAKKRRTAKKEKRLEKAGFFTKKGTFGIVGLTKKRKSSRSRKMRKPLRGGEAGAEGADVDPAVLPPTPPSPMASSIALVDEIAKEHDKIVVLINENNYLGKEKALKDLNANKRTQDNSTPDKITPMSCTDTGTTMSAWTKLKNQIYVSEANIPHPVLLLQKLLKELKTKYAAPNINVDDPEDMAMPSAYIDKIKQIIYSANPGQQAGIDDLLTLSLVEIRSIQAKLPILNTNLEMCSPK